MKLVVGLVVLLCTISLSHAALKAPSAEFRKQLQGPPSEFATFVIPSPESVAQRVDSALIPVHLQASAHAGLSQWVWTDTYPVDTPDEFSIAILSPDVEKIQLYVKPPQWDSLTLVQDSMFEGEDSLGKKSSGPLGIDGAFVPSTTYTFFDPKAGDWQIELRSNTALSSVTSDAPQVYLLVDNKSQIKLYSHLSSYDLEQGNSVGVVVHMYDAGSVDDDLSDETPTPLMDTILTAELDIIKPDGTEVVVEMHDDGLHLDKLANDGIYGAQIPADEVGNYIARAIVSGKTPAGQSFFRTAEHIIAVAPIEALLTGASTAQFDSTKENLIFSVNVDHVKIRDTVAVPSTDYVTVRAYAEVYGTGKDGKTQIPIGWMSGMVDPVEITPNQLAIQLTLNENWIKTAGAVAPFTLKNVVLQDRDTNVILSQKDSIPVVTKATTNSYINDQISSYQLSAQTIEITDEMRYGKRPEIYTQKLQAKANGTAGNGKLLLVHGYCSGPVWPLEDFNDAVIFEDYSASRTNDEFALLIRALGEQYDSYGIAAHSQGGLASLHLKTYYWSGLDVATEDLTKRTIQSVGSPYKGCSLAGLLAAVGGIFGLGCGRNFDLSTDGAALWYSKIPKQADGPEKAVYYFTTTYEEGWWIFSNCVTASNLILHAPNDGTCEIKFSALTSGNNMGTFSGQCHTANMKYPAQCADKNRNEIINNYAAR